MLCLEQELSAGPGRCAWARFSFVRSSRVAQRCADASASTAGDSRLAAVLGLAQECDYDAAHTHRVTRLAQVFDALPALRGLGRQERFWLQSAALLHDTGLVEGPQGHH